MKTLLGFGLALGLTGCTTDKDGNIVINIFTIEDDIQLGQDLRDELAQDPENYPILAPNDYPDAYAHLYEI